MLIKKRCELVFLRGLLYVLLMAGFYPPCQSFEARQSSGLENVVLYLVNVRAYFVRLPFNIFSGTKKVISDNR